MGMALSTQHRDNESSASWPKSSTVMPMPDFWEPSYFLRRHPGSFLRKLESFIFVMLTLTTFGTRSLQPVWDVVRPGNEPGFVAYKNRLQNQAENMNIVSGLLLATNAVFLTTGPPRTDLSDYTTLAPYLCMLSSFAMCMGSLIAGSALLFVMNHAEAKWFREVLTSTRLRLMCTTYLIGFPFYSIGLAGALCGIAGLISSLLSRHKIVYIVVAFTLFMPIFSAVLFVTLVVIPPPPPPPLPSSKVGDSAV